MLFYGRLFILANHHHHSSYKCFSRSKICFISVKIRLFVFKIPKCFVLFVLFCFVVVIHKRGGLFFRCCNFKYLNSRGVWHSRHNKQGGNPLCSLNSQSRNSLAVKLALSLRSLFVRVVHCPVLTSTSFTFSELASETSFEDIRFSTV